MSRSVNPEPVGPGESKSRDYCTPPLRITRVPVETKDSSLVVLYWMKSPATSMIPAVSVAVGLTVLAPSKMAWPPTMRRSAGSAIVSSASVSTAKSPVT